jgi:hypothetical protein
MSTCTWLRSAILASAVFSSLTACAVCERHPAACAVVGAIVIGGAVAAIEAHHGHSAPIPHCHQQPTPLDCRPVMGSAY